MKPKTLRVYVAVDDSGEPHEPSVGLVRARVEEGWTPVPGYSIEPYVLVPLERYRAMAKRQGKSRERGRRMR